VNTWQKRLQATPNNHHIYRAQRAVLWCWVDASSLATFAGTQTPKQTQKCGHHSSLQHRHTNQSIKPDFLTWLK